MKIETVESLLFGGAHFVRITTDSGLSGLGQSGCWGYPAASHAIIEVFEHYLVGQDPLRVEHHWQHLYRMGPFRGSALGGAVSAVDIALWDIKGKHYQAPIWDLLGGRCRDHVRLLLLLADVPTLDTLADAARTAVAEGFTAVKFGPIPEGFADLSTDALVHAVVERTATVRDVVGRDIDIILEFGRKLTPLQALPIINAVGGFNPLFVEDPIQIDSIQAQAEISRRLAFPVANGERMNSIWEFRELLTAGGPQFVRPDLGLAGGLTHCKKIAAVAESFHCAVAAHNFLGPVLTAASVHLDISIANFVAQEFCRADEGAGGIAFKSKIIREGGVIKIPEDAGLGVELDTSVAVQLAPISRPLHQVPLRRDGSVAYSV